MVYAVKKLIPYWMQKRILKTEEKLDGHMIFKSNQGTGDHLKNIFTKKTLKPYASGKVTGIVSCDPKIEKGGHVFFSQLILCLWYDQC